MTECYQCGEPGHMARDCPTTSPPGGQVVKTARRGVPAVWCSYCDEHTRLVDTGSGMQRCPNCHPLRHAQLAQSRKCPQCHATVYEWDHAPCGQHAGPGRPLPRPAARGRPDSTRQKPPDAP